MAESEMALPFLYVNASLCNNCTLCKEACPQNAIDFETNIDIADILEDKNEMIARIKLVSCTICGEKIARGKTHDVQRVRNGMGDPIEYKQGYKVWVGDLPPFFVAPFKLAVVRVQRQGALMN
jgi:ferredoxin